MRDELLRDLRAVLEVHAVELGVLHGVQDRVAEAELAGLRAADHRRVVPRAQCSVGQELVRHARQPVEERRQLGLLITADDALPVLGRPLAVEAEPVLEAERPPLLVHPLEQPDAVDDARRRAAVAPFREVEEPERVGPERVVAVLPVEPESDAAGRVVDLARRRAASESLRERLELLERHLEPREVDPAVPTQHVDDTGRVAARQPFS